MFSAGFLGDIVHVIEMYPVRLCRKKYRCSYLSRLNLFRLVCAVFKLQMYRRNSVHLVTDSNWISSTYCVY